MVVFRARPSEHLQARRAIVSSGIAINLAILAAWLVSRSVGLPAGEHPWTPEAVGTSDAITAILEGGLLLGLLRIQRGRATAEPASSAGKRAAPGTGAYPSIVGAAPILALIVVAAIAAVGAPHAHADGASHDSSVMTLEHEPHTD